MVSRDHILVFICVCTTLHLDLILDFISFIIFFKYQILLLHLLHPIFLANVLLNELTFSIQKCLVWREGGGGGEGSVIFLNWRHHYTIQTHLTHNRHKFILKTIWLNFLLLLQLVRFSVPSFYFILFTSCCHFVSMASKWELRTYS